jgi:hypothetical protein
VPRDLMRRQRGRTRGGQGNARGVESTRRSRPTCAPMSTHLKTPWRSTGRGSPYRHNTTCHWPYHRQDILPVVVPLVAFGRADPNRETRRKKQCLKPAKTPFFAARGAMMSGAAPQRRCGLVGWRLRGVALTQFFAGFYFIYN